MSDFSFLDDKKILVTGGSGTVGFELVKRLALHTNAKIIRVLTNDENGLHVTGSQFSSHQNLRLLLGDVRDKARLVRAFEDIDVVFHLAALKHVYLSEYNPFESVSTNVIGTQNVIDAALINNVEKVILTSSDKAANPGSVLGATKLLAEKLMASANFIKGKNRTMFSSVRFGNVLGSRGSVVPMIRQQLEAGRKIGLTHPDMTRFVMSVDDAIDLLLKVSYMMRGGEVFVFKMAAVRIPDLFSVVARRLSDANLVPENNQDIEFDIIGAKPGEKLHEDLYTEEESRRTWELNDMYVIIPNIPDISDDLITYYTTLGAKRAPVASYSSKMGKMLDSKGIDQLISKIEL